MRKLVAIAAALSLVLIATAFLALSPTERAAVGCYRLTLGPWRHPATGASTQAAEYARLPRAVGLVPAPWTSGGNARLPLLVSRDDSLSGHRFRGWGSDRQSDSLLAHFSTGFSGVTLHLRQVGDTLRGVALETTDVVPVTATAAVIGVPISCRQLAA